MTTEFSRAREAEGKTLYGAAEDIFHDFGGAQDAGHASPGVGAGADKVEPGDIFALIVKAEPRGLRQSGSDGETGSVRGQEGIAEIGRGDVKLGDEVLLEARKNAFLEVIENALGVAGTLAIPIDVVLEVGDWGEDVEGVVPFGCHGRIGGGGAVEVEAEVVGNDTALEDVVEESAVAGTEEDGVMGDVLVAAVGGEVEDEQPHGIFAGGQLLIGPLAPVDGGDELTVDGGRVGVGYNEVSVDLLAAGKAYPSGVSMVEENFFNGGVMAEVDPVATSEVEKGFNEGACAAAGEPDSPLALEVVDERVEAGGIEGIPPDE